MSRRTTERWSARPGLSLLLRAAVYAIPVLCAVAVAVAATAIIPRPPDGLAAIAWWVVVLALSMGTLAVVDILARRLLPLAALLRLSLLFPNQAPSRIRVARQAGRTGGLQRQLERAQQLGESAPPAEAAEIIISLITALSAHDRRTRGHSERVHLYADLLGEEMGLAASDRERLRWAAMLHDIGKLDIDVELLNKPDVPDEDEWERLRRHPEDGRKLIAPLVPWLGEWAHAVEQHHERFDGTGYPAGLAGHEISRAARIVSVADAYEVMTTPRPYKRALPVEAAREELARCAGSQFDPAVVRAFYNVSIGRLRRFAWPVTLGAVLPLAARRASAAIQHTAAQGAAPVSAGAAALAAVGAISGAGLVGPAAPPPVAAAVNPPAEVAITDVDERTGAFDAAEGGGEDARTGHTADSDSAPLLGAADGAVRRDVEDVGDGWAAQGARPAHVRTSDDAGAPTGASQRTAPADAEGPAPAPRSQHGPDGPPTRVADAPGTSGPGTSASGATDDTAAPPPPPSVPPVSGPRGDREPRDDAPADQRRVEPQEPDRVDRGGTDPPPARSEPGRNAPVAEPDSARTQGGTAVVIPVLDNDGGVDASSLRSLRVIVAPQHGGVVRVQGAAIAYTPARGFRGTDRFRYQVCRHGGGCATAWVTVEVD